MNSPTDKKILLVSHNLYHEGAPHSLYYLAIGLKSLGYNVTILSPRDGPLKSKYSNEKIDVVIEPSFWSDPKRGISFYEKFCLVYLNTIINFTLIEPIKNARRLVIWCIRESDRDRFMKLGITKTHFQKVDKVVFVSNATRKIYSDMEFHNNFMTIHNGIDIDEIESFKTSNQKNALRKKYGFSTNDIVITLVGTVIERKGQLVFVNAAIKLLKSNEDKLHFIIVGVPPLTQSEKTKRQKKKFNPLTKIKKFIKTITSISKNQTYKELTYVDRIKNVIEEHNFSNKIHLIPITSKVYDYYLISDIFVCTSFFESFPRVIMEAMAFQLPIISTNVFGIPEQIEDDIDGILLPPGDSNLLAEKIMFLLNNSEKSSKYTKKAYEKVKKDFTNEKVTHSYDILIKQLFNIDLN